jgi:hypothetical protein
MNRGDGGEAVFEDDDDRHGFVRALGEACEETGWQVQAYSLIAASGAPDWAQARIVPRD